MKTIILLSCWLAVSLSACAQGTSYEAKEKKIGGPCEGCEAIYESPVPFEKLKSTATLPDFNEQGPRLEISGTIYQRDGKTPAKDVVLYIYHTDQNGVYPQKGNETGWAKRHGYLRGWIKTDADGHYQFNTLRPASYPNSRAPQHIHPVVKEPGKNEYYIDEYLFTDDPFVDEAVKANQEKRGGSGIINVTKKSDGTWTGKRDIILGLNIPNYK